MCSLKHKGVVFIFIFALSLKCVVSSEYLPLLLWSNAKDVACKDLSLHRPGESISTVFSPEYMRCLSTVDPQNIVMFVYDQLSVDDITKFSDDKNQAFTNIHKYVDTSTISLSVPSVEPANLVGDVNRKLQEVFQGADIKVVVLPAIDRSSDASTAHCLRQHDKVVQKTINELDGTYIAVITAENTVNRKFFETPLGTGRHLLAVNEAVSNTTTYLKGTCVFMTYKSLKLFVGVNSTDLTTEISSFNKETCQNASATNATNTITKNFNVSSNSTLKDVSVMMEFYMEYFPISGRRWWYLKKVMVSYTHPLSGERSVQLEGRTYNKTIYAPRQWSWVCAAPTNMSYITNSSNSNNMVSLEFQHLQVQPFDVNLMNSTFARAVDCSGWFTGAIWTGILVGLVILMIMTFGLGMISQVTTMDRFDDPKGKAMMVPQADGN